MIAAYLQEIQERQRYGGLVGQFHPGQKRIDTALRESQFVAALFPRRQGKTEGLIRRLIHRGMRARDYRAAYIEDFPQTAWEDVLPAVQKLSREFGFAYRTLGQHHTLTIGGLRIRCYGVRHERFRAFMRGKEFDDIVIDEAQRLWDIPLAALTNEVLLHTLADRVGRLTLAGTPGDVDAGLFYRIAREHGAVENPQEVEGDPWEIDQEQILAKLFTLVIGKPFENPAVAKQQRDQLELYRQANENIEQEPWLQREMFGRWVTDNRSRVIKIDPERNYLTEWEPQRGDQYLLGVDYGFAPDPSAFVVAVCNPSAHPHLIWLEAREEGELQHDAMLQIVRDYQNRYPGILTNVDTGGGGKAPLVAMQEDGVPAGPADKREDKRITTNRMNSDATLGLMKFYNVEEPGNPDGHPMVKYWRASKWIMTRKGLDIARPRHKHDAACYLYRQSRHKLYREPEVVDDRYELALRAAKARGQRAYWE